MYKCNLACKSPAVLVLDIHKPRDDAQSHFEAGTTLIITEREALQTDSIMHSYIQGLSGDFILGGGTWLTRIVRRGTTLFYVQ